MFFQLFQSLSKCKAIKDYCSNNPAHLVFKQNELITIEAKYDDNIWVIFSSWINNSILNLIKFNSSMDMLIKCQIEKEYF